MEIEKSKAFTSLLKKAEVFHGHLGPFLVLGLRMGLIALRELCKNVNNDDLRVIVNIPLSTPYSCIIDGVQIATRCTIGNGKLKLKDQKDFSSQFFLQTTKRKITISVNRNFLAKLEERLAFDSSKEALRKIAFELMHLQEEKLFSITRCE
jgi:formylmethanofuran dehydrogenase subunit E